MPAASVAELLRTAGVGPVEARALLRAALGVGDAYLAAHPERVPGEVERRRFLELLARRHGGEPLAYLTGEREFHSLVFRVTPAVLIPRPETELLVEAALERAPEHGPCRVLDLATGSGCIAIAVARHRPQARVTATDRSREALAVARENAARHGVDVEFLESDWFEALPDRRFDLIVANPPYIAAGDPHLEQGDLRFEPPDALVAGPTGLECIEAIVEHAVHHLSAGGRLLLEHGFDQGACARALLAASGYDHVITRRDLAGIERVSGGQV